MRAGWSDDFVANPDQAMELAKAYIKHVSDEVPAAESGQDQGQG